MEHLTPAFLDDFADRLSDPQWLPFLSPRFTVVKPKHYPKHAQELIDRGIAFKFDIQIGTEEPFGHLKVAPQKRHGDPDVPHDPRIFVINGIKSGSPVIPQYNQKPKIGRELVRRAVKYAAEHHYEKLMTSIFSGAATSFWFGLGFRSDRRPQPYWDDAGDLAHEENSWRKKLKDNSDVIWDMARTEFGQRVLCGTGGNGVFNFADPVQRRYVCKRLHLPEDLFHR